MTARPDDSRASAAGLVLAGGQGKRMGSRMPKVLLSLLGEPMLSYIYSCLERVLPRESIWTVVGHKREMIAQAFPDTAERHIFQERQLGTGHAVQCAEPVLRESGHTHCLVVNGDVPLIEAHHLQSLLELSLSKQAAVSLISMRPADPSGYGRVIRDESGRVQGVVEERDLAPGQTAIEEVNAGIYCLDLARIGPYLQRMDRDNAQGEYYLPQLAEMAAEDGAGIEALCADQEECLLGINSPGELVRMESLLQQRIANYWLQRGVILRSPEQARIGPRVVLEPGCEITGPLEIYGESSIGAGASVEAQVRILDSSVGPRAWIRSFSHLEGAEIGSAAQVGPYARLRSGAVLGEESRAGNFVEVKKATLGPGSKANHLAYIGDASVGGGANIGAGCITCNYDGVAKHRTVIRDNAFIGSNSSLVAPVEIGADSVVGAGSTITKDVPRDSLAVSRVKQKTLHRKGPGKGDSHGSTGQTGGKDS